MLLYLLLIFELQAKFSTEVFKIPCRGLDINITSCQDNLYHNKDYILKKKLTNEVLIQYQAALVKARIKKNFPVKCYDKQKMNLETYKPLTPTEQDLIVVNTSCAQITQKKNIQVKILNKFCDTPGAMSIKECFENYLEYKHKALVAYPIQ